MLDMIVQSTEKDILHYRVTQVAGGNQLPHKPWHLLFGVNYVGANMIDQEDSAQVGADEPGH